MSIALTMPSSISSSDALFFVCPQFFPASGSFPRSQLFPSDDPNSLSAWMTQKMYRDATSSFENSPYLHCLASCFHKQRECRHSLHFHSLGLGKVARHCGCVTKSKFTLLTAHQAGKSGDQVLRQRVVTLLEKMADSCLRKNDLIGVCCQFLFLKKIIYFLIE